jgi:hypothetical protein
MLKRLIVIAFFVVGFAFTTPNQVQACNSCTQHYDCGSGLGSLCGYSSGGHTCSDGNGGTFVAPAGNYCTNALCDTDADCASFGANVTCNTDYPSYQAAGVCHYLPPPPTFEPTPIPPPPPEPTPVLTSSPSVEPTIQLPVGFSSVVLAENATTTSALDINGSDGVGVVFNSTFDLTNEALKVKLQNLSQYVEMGTMFVSVDSVNFPELNVPATIKLKLAVTTIDTIMVFKDGEDYTSQVTNLSYDPTTQIVSFDVTGFSRYEVVDAGAYLQVSSGQAADQTTAEPMAAANPTLLIAMLLLIIVIGGVGASYWWLQRGKSEVITQTTIMPPTEAV